MSRSFCALQVQAEVEARDAGIVVAASPAGDVAHLRNQFNYNDRAAQVRSVSVACRATMHILHRSQQRAHMTL